jgi:hypothetical protein|tara:strand:+ start:192 stop:380 length:189 start_codon:yes stop_codon:yes gene_type:complete
MIIKESNLNDYILKSRTAKTSRMLIFITPEEKEALKSLSCTSGLSMTEIIRRAMYNALNVPD